MRKEIILFPFGGNAREALLSIFAVNKMKKAWRIIGFVDDDNSTWGKACCGIKVLGARKMIDKFPEAKILAVPGNPDNYTRRKDIIALVTEDRDRFATIIHPSATVSPDASVGYNTVLMPNVVLSCGAKVGNHCVILPNTVISHDSSVGDYCCVGSNVSISGEVKIEPMCYIGSGVKVRERVRIGRRSLIGLGANVVSDIKKEIVAAGNPAKAIRKV